MKTGNGVRHGAPVFLPSAVVSALFRGKFLYELRGLQQRGEINYPPDLNPTLLSNLMNKLGRKNWRIRLMERYAHGNGVATYLARYVRGGPIHNKQLRDDGTGHIVMLLVAGFAGWTLPITC